MDKKKEYLEIAKLGEGSFGRVFKAKRLSDSKIVAMKVIRKEGRKESEVKDLNQECEIQRKLNHPNIIKMLDAFETENEIYVITEYAEKPLNVLLQEVKFNEETSQPIIWDLVSALYYLHSHRILHRDLKPQNILINSDNITKLCDFGFARHMSTDTHVLTSVKGTPLYMAPELIEEKTYDHNADLWSLGCIIYELLKGEPPFSAQNLLQLVNCIRKLNENLNKYDPIKWPTNISDHCQSFLQGLLQKDPLKRMQWPDILKHPFVKNHILIPKTKTEKPLTRYLSENTLQLKEQQMKEHTFQTTTNNKESEKIKIESQDMANNNLLQEKIQKMSLEEQDSAHSVAMKEERFDESNGKLNFFEENNPIETEEWIVFLQKSMEELINGELTSLMQPNLTNILVSPLKNSNSAPNVLGHVAKLFSLPLVIRGIPESTLLQIRKNYFQVKLVPNLVYATRLICKVKNEEDNINITVLSEDSLQSLECIYLLIVHLVYLEDEFLNQFCEALTILNDYAILGALLLSKNKTNLVADILAVLTHILRIYPENCELVEKIVLGNRKQIKAINFVELLRHSDSILRNRACLFLMFFGKQSKKIELLWNETVRETLEGLVYDSIISVRNTAEKTVQELKNKEFYKVIEEQPEDTL